MHWYDAASRPWLTWNPPDQQTAMGVMQGPPPTDIDDLPPAGRAVGQAWSNGRLASQELRHDGVTLHTRSYGHGPDGRVTSIVDSHLASWAYVYDDLGRLTGAALTENNQPVMTLGWTYDTKGNRLTETRDGVTTSYSHNVGNRDGDRLLAITGPGGTTSYTYDAYGRPLTKTAPGNAVTTYSWNAMGRLAGLALPNGTTAAYTYDSWGERTSKTVTSGGNSVTTQYVRAGGMHYEYDDAGDLFAVTGFREDGYTPEWRTVATGDVYYYHTDHLGTPIWLTDLTGAVVWSATIEPFGHAHVEPGSVDQPWRFPGQTYDEESGLHYNRQRYYDPQTGRYLNPDPIGQAGGRNLNAYCASNPISCADPSALSVVDDCIRWCSLIPATIAGGARATCIARCDADKDYRKACRERAEKQSLKDFSKEVCKKHGVDVDGCIDRAEKRYAD